MFHCQVLVSHGGRPGIMRWQERACWGKRRGHIKSSWTICTPETRLGPSATLSTIWRQVWKRLIASQAKLICFPKCISLFLLRTCVCGIIQHTLKHEKCQENSWCRLKPGCCDFVWIDPVQTADQFGAQTWPLTPPTMSDELFLSSGKQKTLCLKAASSNSVF